MPERWRTAGGIRYALAARAVADAAWGQADVRSVRALVADAVQRKACTVPELVAELRSGAKQGSAALRAALAEVADGIASVAEGDLRRLIKKGGLPEPMYNPRLFVGTLFLAQPDAWWPSAGVAAEVDSREWHLSPDGWERTLARHARMTAQGILVLHYAPRRIRSEPAAVIEEIRKALAAGGPGPRAAARSGRFPRGEATFGRGGASLKCARRHHHARRARARRRPRARCRRSDRVAVPRPLSAPGVCRVLADGRPGSGRAARAGGVPAAVAPLALDLRSAGRPDVPAAHRAEPVARKHQAPGDRAAGAEGQEHGAPARSAAGLRGAGRIASRDCRAAGPASGSAWCCGTCSGCPRRRRPACSASRWAP